MKRDLLADLRNGVKLGLKEQLELIIRLSIPGILAQISTILMEYIDASMVGRLTPEDSAAIGLVSSTIWLFGGINLAAGTGFNVQVAHYIGANDEKKARHIVKQGLLVSFIISLLMMALAVSVSGVLPYLLGGDPAICARSTKYFRVYAFAMPVMMLNYLVSGMIQCSGNMRFPSIMHILMCIMDVIFNMFMIFPTREYMIFGSYITLPGLDLGVTGASLGTVTATAVGVFAMLFYLIFVSPSLKLRDREGLQISKKDMTQAVKIAAPIGLEQIVMCGAQVASTKIVSPLGNIAISAHSFAVTAESLCYMPGYGIGAAATTLIGQSIGAKRDDLTKRLGWLCVFLGMGVMALAGIFMYIFAPEMIGILTPNPEIRALGTAILRIEAFAEPFYAASIVCNGVFRGAGDTLAPCILNLCSMWIIRLPLAALLAARIGLRGVWIAMCIELTCRGIFLLVRLYRKKWERL